MLLIQSVLVYGAAQQDKAVCGFQHISHLVSLSPDFLPLPPLSLDVHVHLILVNLNRLPFFFQETAQFSQKMSLFQRA